MKTKKIVLSLMTLSLFLPLVTGCKNSSDENYITVHFDPNTTISVYDIEDKELSEPRKIIPPTVVVKDASTNPDNKGVSGWYTEKDCINKFDFKTTKIEKSTTLYAKWDKQFTISYYLNRSFDTSEGALGTEVCFENDNFVDRSDLYDGYEFLGYYTDPTFKEESKIDLSSGLKVTKDMNVYIKRSEYLYFTPSALANRFDNAVAAAGSGSTTPTVELKSEGQDTFFEINFGYSTSKDPYVYSSNPSYDISKTKKLEIKFKNKGKAERLKLYWAVKDPLNNYTDGTGSYSEYSAIDHQYTDDEKNMTDWKTITIDVSSVVKNGYSTWGVGNQLVRLRIQNNYLSENKEDYSNVLQIAYIKGINSDDYKKAEDTDPIKALCKDDTKEELLAKKKEQESSTVKGFLFPRDDSKIDSITPEAACVFDKTTGALLHSNYGDGKVEAKFKYISDDVESSDISLDDLTTISVTLKNYGYVDKIKVIIENDQCQISQVELGLSTKNDAYVTYETNMFAKDIYYKKTLRSVTVSYETTGVDNAISIEKIEFKDYKENYIHGINFVDKNCQHITPDVGSESKFTDIKYQDSSTYLNIGETGASFTVTRLFDNFTIHKYSTLDFSYICNTKGITKVQIDVKLKDKATAASYSFDISKSSSLQKQSLDLIETGYVESIKFTFEGTGVIKLKSLSFGLPDSAIDFQTRSYFDKMLAGWQTGESYSTDYSAASIGNGSQFLCYYGGDGVTGLVNYPLVGTSKIVLIYQNPSNDDSIYIGMGCGPTTGLIDVKVNNRYIGSDTGTGYQKVTVKTNMGPTEWDFVELDFKTILQGKGYSDISDWVATLIGLTGYTKLLVRGIFLA